MQKNTNILEIGIPTYNRSIQLEKCLSSILVSLENLPIENRKLIGITISNNSTKDIINRNKIIGIFENKFKEFGVGYFTHHITGYNIGMVNNMASVYINSKSDYIWSLGDDDIMRFDALETVLNVIKQYEPCFIAGGWVQKAKVGYFDNQIKNDDRSANNVYKVLHGEDKLNTFLLKNTVQQQEYIYKTSQLKTFFEKDDNIQFLTEMQPGLLAIYCMQNEGPLVLLKNSVGIFRHDEPDSNSGWRHLWLRFALQDWPLLSEKLYKLKWLNKKQLNLSVGIWRNLLFTAAPCRPDIFLGINRKYDLSPFKLFYFHRATYLKALLIFIPSIFIKIINLLKLNFKK
jgi:hypothetical protein